MGFSLALRCFKIQIIMQLNIASPCQIFSNQIKNGQVCTNNSTSYFEFYIPPMYVIAGRFSTSPYGALWDAKEPRMDSNSV